MGVSSAGILLVPAAGAASTAALLGLTVMTGVPLAMRDLVVKDAANADCVAKRALLAGLQVDGVGDGSAEDGTSTVAGDTASYAAWRASTFGTTR